MKGLASSRGKRRHCLETERERERERTDVTVETMKMKNTLLNKTVEEAVPQREKEKKLERSVALYKISN